MAELTALNELGKRNQMKVTAFFNLDGTSISPQSISPATVESISDDRASCVAPSGPDSKGIPGENGH